MQSLLARLYVDDCCRELFLQNPDAVLSKYRLGEEEKTALLGIDEERLEFHAKSLVRKREKRLRRFFPHLFKINDKAESAEVERLLFRFQSLHPSFPGEEDAVEIRRFASFVAKSLGTPVPGFPDYAGDLARYEGALAVLSNRTPTSSRRASSDDGPAAEAQSEFAGDDSIIVAPNVRTASFDYPVTEIAESLEEGNLPVQVEQEKITLVFRIQDGDLRTFRVSGPAAELLRYVRRERTVRDLISHLEDYLGTSELSDSVRTILHQFHDQRIIVAP